MYDMFIKKLWVDVTFHFKVLVFSAAYYSQSRLSPGHKMECYGIKKAPSYFVLELCTVACGCWNHIPAIVFNGEAPN